MTNFETQVVGIVFTVQLVGFAWVVANRIFRPRLGRWGKTALCLGLLAVAASSIAALPVDYSVSVAAGVTVVLMTLATTITAGRPQPAHPF